MRNNIDEDIQKIFEFDSKNKKRIGINIFSRVSTRKGGSGTLRTPYYFMNAKERKKLNGEVVTFNMYETILPKEEFFKLKKEDQKRIMSKWREKFETKEIIEKMGISKVLFYKLLNELGIELNKRKSKKDNVIVLTEEQIQYYKENIIPYDMFLSLSNEQRAELLFHYIDNMNISSEELAKTWNIKTRNLYNFKYRLSKYKGEEDKDNEVKQIENNTNTELIENANNIEVIPKKNNLIHEFESLTENIIKVIQSINNKSIQQVQNNESKGFYFTINKKGNNKQIIKQLQMLISLLEDEEDGEYKISLTVEGE
jgi:hypothetical protein